MLQNLMELMCWPIAKNGAEVNDNYYARKGAIWAQ